MYSLYSVLVLVVAVVASPWFIYQALRYKKYVGSLGQRMGYLPVSFNMDGDESIWIHAVSVGEVLTARPLISDLKRRYPNLRMFLSTTTMAGQQLARRNVQDVDAVFYFPFDLGFVVRRTLDLVRPKLFIMMETEIWPNLLRECRARGVKTAVVNGRLSARSFPRYRMIRPMMRRVLDHIDRFLVQSEESARRFIDLGADPARVVVTGSLKFDSLELSSTALQARARDRVLRYFRVPRIAAGDRGRQHDEGRGDRGAARVQARADRRRRTRCWCSRRATRSDSAKRSSWRGRKAGRWRGDPIWRSTPNRASTSSCSTPSASWRRSIRSRRSCSSAAASSRPAATTCSSPRCSASRSCSARTCRTSSRSPRRSSATAPACS